MSSKAQEFMFTHQITVREMEDIICFGQRRKRAVFFYGGAGVGKSQKVAEVADKLFPHRKGNNLIDVRLSDKEPQDVTGCPVPVTMPDGTTRTVYAVPSFWPTEPNWEGIVFLDELTNASIPCQQAAYQIMLDGKIGEYTFPPSVIRVGAGNRESDGGAITPLLAPLANRMVLTELRYDLDVWIEDFAVPKAIHPFIIGLLKQFPDKFYTGHEAEDNQGSSYASPRTWEVGSDCLYDLDSKKISERIANIILQGVVGDGMDSVVMAYYLRAKKLPSLESIFSGTAKEPDIGRNEVDLVYVLTQSCLMEIAKEVNGSKFTDEEILDRITNFLNYMIEHFSVNNMDLVISMAVSLFNQKGNTKAVLTQNPKRQKLGPRLLRHSPTIGKLIFQYEETFGELLREIEDAVPAK